jgi:hypothetical protein
MLLSLAVALALNESCYDYVAYGFSNPADVVSNPAD